MSTISLSRPVKPSRRGGLAAIALAAIALATAGCDRDLSPPEDYVSPSPNVGQNARGEPNDTIFGTDGINIGDAIDGSLLEGEEQPGGGALPVNRYLWQASLDTLSFMPLASTDPFTGVIATEWATTPENPGQRFKVTAYILSHELQASSLRVAVFREDRTVDGIWVPRPVSTETVTRLEDAILTRSRQIRIAEVEDGQAS